MLFETDIRKHRRAILDRYERLRVALTDRYRARLTEVQPALGWEACFHHCHNWGSDAARMILEKYHRRHSQIIRRSEREYKFAE